LTLFSTFCPPLSAPLRSVLLPLLAFAAACRPTLYESPLLWLRNPRAKENRKFLFSFFFLQRDREEKGRASSQGAGGLDGFGVLPQGGVQELRRPRRTHYLAGACLYKCVLMEFEALAVSSESGDVGMYPEELQEPLGNIEDAIRRGRREISELRMG
ncbi:hypothetical protein Taro_044612, partial [Colocasia esculenta]|nr:hypothetical protein [Colocasia esculenta]